MQKPHQHRPAWAHPPVQALTEPGSLSSAINPEASSCSEDEASSSSSSLDPLETTATSRYLLNRWQARVHGRCWRHRAAVIKALHASIDHRLLKRARSMCLCSSSPSLGITASGEARVRAIRCKDRLCPLCEDRRIARAKSRVDQLVHQFDNCRMITLTVTDHGEGLRAQVDRLLRYFKAFRRTLGWKNHVRRGVYCLQVTSNQKTKTWHAHLHVLVEGEFWAQAEISKLWLVTTGDSPVVDIRVIHSRSSATSYVARYVTRGDTIASWEEESIQEYALAMKGVRLFQSFGKGVPHPVVDEKEEGKEVEEESAVPIRWIEKAARERHGPSIEVIQLVRVLHPAVGELFSEDVASDGTAWFSDEAAAKGALCDLMKEVEANYFGRQLTGPPRAVEPRWGQLVLFQQHRN